MVETALSSVLDVGWVHDGCVRSGSELDDEVEFAIETTSEALRESPDSVAKDVLREVLFSVNLSRLVDTPQKLGNMVLGGYDYNSWPRPTEL